MPTITNPRLPLSPAYDRVRLNQVLEQLPVVYNPQLFGAVGDGVTDDTAAINAAILKATVTGGVVAFPPGTYMASQITIYRHVILDGGNASAVCLKQIAASNVDFIISENFAACTGTTKFQPTNTDVPSWFGLKDIKIDASGQTAGTPRGIAWFGHPQFMIGTVYVTSARGDNIYTEDSFITGSPTFESMESGFFDTVISHYPGGVGWRFRGPHNAAINNFLGIVDTGSDYGFYSETTATASGVTDLVGQIHVYPQVAGNQRGIFIGSSMNASLIGADGTKLKVASTDGPVTLHQVNATFAGSVTNMEIGGSYATTIYFLIGAVQATGGQAHITWSGSNGYLGGATLFDGVGAANTIGMEVTGSTGQFRNLNVSSFSGAGSIGIKNSGFQNQFNGFIQACKTAFHHAGSGSTWVDLDIYTNAGQAAVGGSLPTTADRWDIRSTGAVVGGTRVKAYGNAVIDLNTLANQAVTFPHNCLFTPTAQDIVGMTISSFVIDYQWALIPIWWVATATTITLSCTLALISATPGAKASVTLDIRIGA